MDFAPLGPSCADHPRTEQGHDLAWQGGQGYLPRTEPHRHASGISNVNFHSQGARRYSPWITT